jgi:hypothetical protein
VSDGHRFAAVGSIRRCIPAFRDAGGDVARVPIGRFPVVGETDETARQAAWPAAERLTAGYRRGGYQLRRGILTEGEHDTERWLNEVAIVGSPETVAERIAATRSSVSGASSWSRAFSATSRKNMFSERSNSSPKRSGHDWNTAPAGFHKE